MSPAFSAAHVTITLATRSIQHMVWPFIHIASILFHQFSSGDLRISGQLQIDPGTIKIFFNFLFLNFHLLVEISNGFYTTQHRLNSASFISLSTALIGCLMTTASVQLACQLGFSRFSFCLVLRVAEPIFQILKTSFKDFRFLSSEYFLAFCISINSRF
jgi:hypothetical protein